MRRIEQYKKELSEHARTGILSFWGKNLKLTPSGSFYPNLNVVGDVTDPLGDISVIFQARILWSFAHAYRKLGDQSYLEMANQAYQALVQNFHDRELKGWFYHSSIEGVIKDSRKHLYAQSFVIYALSEYALATKKERARLLALETFYTICLQAKDQIGFYESFDSNWKKTTQIFEYGVCHEEKTMNTHIHLLEAFTNLYLLEKTLEIKRELTHLVDIIIDKVYNHLDKTLYLYFDQHFNPIGDDKFSYGHDIEVSWLLEKASLALSKYRYQDVCYVANQLALNVRKNAFLQSGEIEYEYDQQKNSWWVQAEAMKGFFHAYMRTKNTEFFKSFQRIKKWNLHSQFDQNNLGWHEDIRSVTHNKSSNWKTPYHSLRSCFY